MPHTVFLAFGSNVGDKVANIHQAIQLLQPQVNHLQRGQLYETKPVGYLQQDNFVNTAAVGETELNPIELFQFVKDIEQKVGRIKRFRWGPREIDIDLLFYDDRVADDEVLTLPHPRLHQRDFVLRPLLDIAPDFRHPVLQKTIRELLVDLPPTDHSVLNKLG